MYINLKPLPSFTNVWYTVLSMYTVHVHAKCTVHAHVLVHALFNVLYSRSCYSAHDVHTVQVEYKSCTSTRTYLKPLPDIIQCMNCPSTYGPCEHTTHLPGHIGIRSILEKHLHFVKHDPTNGQVQEIGPFMLDQQENGWEHEHVHCTFSDYMSTLYIMYMHNYRKQSIIRHYM